MNETLELCILDQFERSGVLNFHYEYSAPLQPFVVREDLIETYE